MDELVGVSEPICIDDVPASPVCTVRIVGDGMDTCPPLGPFTAWMTRWAHLAKRPIRRLTCEWNPYAVGYRGRSELNIAGSTSMDASTKVMHSIQKAHLEWIKPWIANSQLDELRLTGFANSELHTLLEQALKEHNQKPNATPSHIQGQGIAISIKRGFQSSFWECAHQGKLGHHPSAYF